MNFYIQLAITLVKSCPFAQDLMNFSSFKEGAFSLNRLETVYKKEKQHFSEQFISKYSDQLEAKKSKGQKKIKKKIISYEKQKEMFLESVKEKVKDENNYIL